METNHKPVFKYLTIHLHQGCDIFQHALVDFNTIEQFFLELWPVEMLSDW